MLKPILRLFDPLLQPVDRTRGVCLLLLVTLVTVMLFLGSTPGIEVLIPDSPWDKVTHLIVFGVYAGLAWVVLGARSYFMPILAAAAIALMDEIMQYYSPGRTAAMSDILADLVGAILAIAVLWILKGLVRRRPAGGAQGFHQ